MTAATARDFPPQVVTLSEEDHHLEAFGTMWLVLCASEQVPDDHREKERLAKGKKVLLRKLTAAGFSTEQLERHLQVRCQAGSGGAGARVWALPDCG